MIAWHTDHLSVFVSSRPGQCLDRLETYANVSPTVMLVELHGKISTDSAPTDGGSDKASSTLAFLRQLSADIQGARFQKHVMSFALTVMDKTSPAESGSGAAITRDSFTAGALDVFHSPLEHDDVNRLVGHVKEITRPPARLVGAPMAQNLVDSIRDASVPIIACHRPDEAISDKRKTEIEEAVRQWAFPASNFNMDELTYGAVAMLEHILRHPQLEGYDLPRAQLVTFLLATRRQYKHEREVHYHNWRHAVDVTQSIYVILSDIQLWPPLDSDGPPSHEPNAVERMLTPLDGLILLISAIGHDVGHPGVNNAFLIACNHPLAQTYNDKSVLENYHCAAYTQLLRRHWPSLSSIPGFRSALISNILATDMQRHFEYMSNLKDLKSKVEDSEESPDHWSDKDKSHTRELIMALLMKAADISNVARPFDVSANWAKILMNEFARQGELESELQIPTCLFGGPPNKEDPLAAAQSQKGFMSLFGYPLFNGLSEIMTGISCSIIELENNQKTWDQRIEDEKRKQKTEPLHEELHLSSVSAKEVNQAVGGHHKSAPAALPTEDDRQSSTPAKRSAATSPGGSPSKQASQDLRCQLTDGVFLDGEKRGSGPYLASAGMPLSPSRRSSKDIALDHYQQLHAFAQQSLESGGSRRGSADAGFQIHRSYPGSRRGSKDEALTVIHVTPGRQASPSSPGKRSSPAKSISGGKRQSVPSNSKQNPPARTSFPSSRSHATSSATATTSPDSPSVSTQPSSVVTEDDQPTPPGRHASIAATEDPFIAPGSWPNNLDGAHRMSSPPGEGAGALPSTPPPPPVNGATKPDNPQILTRLASSDTDDRGTPRKPSGFRESRSRSRLRGLKFWKKRNRDVSGIEQHGHTAGSTTSVPPDSPARS